MSSFWWQSRGISFAMGISFSQIVYYGKFIDFYMNLLHTVNDLFKSKKTPASTGGE